MKGYSINLWNAFEYTYLGDLSVVVIFGKVIYERVGHVGWCLGCTWESK